MTSLIFIVPRVVLFFVSLYIIMDWTVTGIRPTTHFNREQDNRKCFEHIQPVSYQTCLNLFEDNRHKLNVAIYIRKYLLCELCCEGCGIKPIKVPGSLLKYYPVTGEQCTNIAQGKSATQISTWTRKARSGVASLAVDGIWETDLFDNESVMCSHTSVHDSNILWWMVDLEHVYLVSSVVILNRGDCCWRSLRALTITVGETIDEMKVCNKFKGPGRKAEIITITCKKPRMGKFVRISKRGDRALQLYEVAVNC